MMMKLKKQLLVSAMLIVGAVMVQGQSMELSLDAAKQYAYDYNRTLKKSGLSVAEAKSAKWEAIAAGLPHVSASYSYQNPMDYEINFGVANITMSETQTAELQVSQLLFSGSYWVGIQLADIAKKMSVISLKKTELDISKEVTSSYQSILVAKEIQKILEANYENVKGLLDKTEQMVAVGATEKTNADQLKVQVASTENAIKENERQLEVATNLFRFQLGLGSEDEIVFSDSLAFFVDESQVSGLLLEQLVLNNNYDMMLVNQNHNLAKKQVNMARSKALPTISAYYNYTEKIATSGLDMTPPHVVGISASLPLFTSFETTSSIKQAKYQLKSSELTKQDTKEQLLLTEKQLRFNLKNAFESYKIQKENIEVATSVFKDYSLKYEQGVASGLELTTANNNFLTAQSNYVSSIMNLLNAENELKNLLGKK